MADQFLYGQAGTLYFSVLEAGGTRFATNGDWTPGGSNAIIIKDGVVSGFAAATVAYVGSKTWALPLSVAELSAKRVTVLCSEPGTIDDKMIAVDTIQNVLAHFDTRVYDTKIRPSYNVNDDKLVAAGWVERDGVALDAASATFNLYTYDGTLVYGNSEWDAGPAEVIALNTWFVEKDTATLVKGGTTYVMVAEFDIGGVSYKRIEAFGAFGTGTGA